MVAQTTMENLFGDLRYEEVSIEALCFREPECRQIRKATGVYNTRVNPTTGDDQYVLTFIVLEYGTEEEIWLAYKQDDSIVLAEKLYEGK